MQSIGKLRASQASYYTEQIQHSVGEDVPVLRGDRTPDQVDYYVGHESPSRWMGRGLERLDLQAGAAVDANVFQCLMAHLTPAGESMTRARGGGSVAAFDHTFSAPKSVSLLYAFGDERVRAAVRDAHHKAVAEGVEYMEEHASQTRFQWKEHDDTGLVRVRARTMESDGYVAAAFDHFTSRANDPQVHTHVVVINRVHAEDGWRALDAKRSYAHAKAGGSIYQAALRDELTHSLGVHWQPVVSGQADIAGLSHELLEHFSTRRREILDAVERYVADTGGEVHRRVLDRFTLETRQAKTYPRGERAVTQEMKDYGVGSDVTEFWRQHAQAAPENVIEAVDRVIAAGRQGIRPNGVEVAAAAHHITEWVGERQAVFTERDLIAQISTLFPDGGTGTELAEATRVLVVAAENQGSVLRVLPHRTDGLILPDGINLASDEIVAIGHGGWVEQRGTVRFRALPGEPRYTTATQIQREHHVLAAVDASSSAAVDVAAVTASADDRGLTDAQRKAMHHLAEQNGQIVTLVGPGGSGKTYAIASYASGVESSGGTVVGASTSAAAARELGEDLGPDRWTGTIAMMRHQTELTGTTLAPHTTVIVDEASMVSTRDLDWLVSQVEACHGRLVLMGDPKQLPSVDSGGMFHRIVTAGDGVVTDLADVNQRQRSHFDRATLVSLREGKVRDVIGTYAQTGRLHLGETPYDTRAAMVDQWWTDVTQHRLEDVRMLASRHDEVAVLNQMARVRMQQAGELSGPVLTTRWGTELQTGDRIVVRDNWYRHNDLRNGQTGTITHVNPEQGTIIFTRDGDGTSIELPKRYVDRDVQHGYAQTIHTAQGQTFEITHALADDGVRAEHGYTALSRARGQTHLWVADRQTPTGDCIHHIQGTEQMPDDRLERLIRQLAESVVDAPAIDQGLPVTSATDHDLITWQNELGDIITGSPLARDVTDELAATRAALDDARQIAARTATSGAHRQVAILDTQLAELERHVERRSEWIDANAGIVHRYSTISEELAQRIHGRLAAYEINPPADLHAAIGAKPVGDPARTRAWTRAASQHAEARIRFGDAADLTDTAVDAPRWREAAHYYREVPTAAIGSPALRLAR